MATLKISDLSVGDWVEFHRTRGIYIAPPLFDHANAQVIGTHRGAEVSLLVDGKREFIAIPLSAIRPIPITAEILEKNGFARGQRGHFYHYLLLDKYRTLYIHASTNGWRVQITYDAAGILRTTHLMPDMNRVHQLQHALRLACVDKEIVIPNK